MYRRNPLNPALIPAIGSVSLSVRFRHPARERCSPTPPFAPDAPANCALPSRSGPNKSLPKKMPSSTALQSVAIADRPRLAETLARTPHRPFNTVRLRFYLWSGAAAAACLLVGASIYPWWVHRNSPESLLAGVYGHERVFMLRMPEAAYSPVAPAEHLRGGTSGREPADLLAARASIAQHLDRTPQDPHWLELQARSDVLEENFDPAIDILDRLAAAGPVSSDLFADAGAAYFQRGLATGSQNDRATALDYLRRADGLAPGDPIVLFNEAIVMEDRGQVMNAVETWNRFLRFERDPQWLAEGRARLASLEQKLNRLKTHQSRLEQHLATPQAMLALASDQPGLAGMDEELSTSLLPRLLYSAFPSPVDRSRGSPCDDSCAAARSLLHALADSLERNHQDPWLTQFLPSSSSPLSPSFSQAAYFLGKAIDANLLADFPASEKWALQSRNLFHRMGDSVAEDRAEVERAYSLQRSFRLADCDRAARSVQRRSSAFAWIRISAGLEGSICNEGPGTASEDLPSLHPVLRLAQKHRYKLLELRTKNMQAGLPAESGDSEESWQMSLAAIGEFYSGDYPPDRLFNLIAQLAIGEQATPRVQSTLLLNEELAQILELAQSSDFIPAEHMYVAAAAIRAGAMPEAHEQMRLAQDGIAKAGSGNAIHAIQAEIEIDLANFYLGRADFDKARESLDLAQSHMAGDDNFLHRRAYAAARGALDLASGHPELAEPLLRNAILDEERQGKRVGEENVAFAMQNRDLYATLAGVWLKQNRPAEDVLALWERYRLRIIGRPVPVCGDKRLDCLHREVSTALAHLGSDKLTGQVVLPDRVLIYRADARGVEWTTRPFAVADVLAASGSLERAASSPTTSRDSIDQSARRVGDIFFRQPQDLPNGDAQLLIEPDPLLGNLTWPAIEVSGQPIGLTVNLEETPSLLLASRPSSFASADFGALIVGASDASGGLPPLPEALSEAREVSHFTRDPHLLLAANATEPQVAAALALAPAIHFAGHAVQRFGETRLVLAPGTQPGGAAYLDTNLLRKHPPRAARLVVFSACSTGKREESWNHDMGDIVNTLASEGVPEVVATRWQIDSSSAVPMMNAFYGGLAQGLPVSTALRRARSSLSRDPRYWHPYYWAAYYASGKGVTDLREVFHDGSIQ